MEVPEKIKERVESLLPGQAIVIECMDRSQAKDLHKRIEKWLLKEQLEEVLPHSYTVSLQQRLAPLRYLVTIRCFERPKLRKLELREGKWEILDEEVI